MINHGLISSLDSSRDLQPICIKNFVNRLHLVLQISKIPSEKKFTVHLNTAFLQLNFLLEISGRSNWRIRARTPPGRTFPFVFVFLEDEIPARGMAARQDATWVDAFFP